MEKYNMKKIITLLMLTLIVSISYAQYTPMTAAGYQFKRILCDSTLHIPSFCGIPTLRNSTAKNGAIAMDTCNFKIYMWTNAAGWGEIIGAGTDTTSLSNRIDQRVKYTDTAQMLLAYLRKQDTANRFVANVTKVNDSTIRVFKGSTITDLKILGKQIDTTSLSNRIDQKLGKADSTIYYTKYRSDTSRTNIYNAINTKLSKSDSTLFYTKYRSDTSRTNIYNAINQKLNITDTTNKWVNNVTKVNDSTIRVWKGTTSTTIELPRGSGGGGGTGTVYNVSTGYALSGGPINTTGTIIVDSAVLSTKYLRRADTSNLVATKSNVALKLNISDSAAMLSKYLRKVDTLSLSNRINLKLNIADTSNKWVNNVTKKNDSTITVFKGATATDITLPRGSTGSVTNVGTGYGLSGGPITSTGTIIVDSATLSTKYLRRADTSNLVATKSNVALKLNISDTANKWVNNVTKINDTAIRVWKGTTSTVISLAKDVVYTQSPIMSKVSNDSNIIYFNADTANVWRGGGGPGTTPTLQEVTTAGAITVDPIILNDNIASLWHTNLNTIENPVGNVIYYPIKWSDEYSSGYGHIKSFDNATGNNLPEFLMGTSGSSTSEIKLNTDEIAWRHTNTTKLIPYEVGNDPGYDYTLRLPVYDGFIDKDTLATLKDLRGGGGGGGTGTVTNVATGYGLTGGPITTTGTLIVDTATLSGKYIQGTGTKNYVPKFLNNRIIGNSDIADSSSVIYFTNNNLQFDYPSSVSRITSTQKINLQSMVTSGDRVIIGTTGGNSGTTTNEVVGELGDLSTTSGTKVNTLLRGRLLHSSGTQEVTFLNIVPNFNQSGTPTTTTRGIYYNPTFTTAYTGKNIAFQSTSGDIILNKLKTSSSTTDSIAIFVNDTLKKAPYPIGGGSTQNGRFGNDTATIVMAKIHNNSGATLTNGKVVFLATSGTNADAPSVRLANNKHDSTSANTFGFVSGSIANNDTGYIILSGKIEKLNTSAFSNGDVIYLDSISGQWTNSKPIAPYHMVYLGVVVKANAGNGSIFVKCQNGYELDEIHDVQITSKLNNQVLAYSDTQKVWKNRNIYALVDTTPFQRKSIASYSLMANNTNATGNATTQTFRDTSGTYAGTITWNGTAPTTQTINAYQWQQTGKMVHLQLFGYYTNTGTACSSVTFTLPSDCPTPDISMFTSGALATLYQGIGALGTSNVVNTFTTTAYMRRNAANTANELYLASASANYRRYQFDITYRAQ